MTTLTSRLTIRNDWRYANANGISSPVDVDSYSKTIEYANGSGDNQVQDLFVYQGTVLANEEDAHDVAGGILNVFGQTLTEATIKELWIYNSSTVSGDDLLVGGGPSPTGGALWTTIFDGEADGRLRIKAGGGVLLFAPLTGYSVTGGSADIIRIFNDGVGAILYDLILKGTH